MRYPFIAGTLAGAGLLVLYFTIMTILGGWEAAVEQFRALWFLMLPLAAGFGVQVGLYTTLSQGAGGEVWRVKEPKARGGMPFRSAVTALAKKIRWRAGGLDIDGARQRHTDLSAEGIRSPTGSIAASGTSASVSMLACCAHHATDVLPFLGLSGVSIFLTQYQKPILLVSLGINAVGIVVMLKQLKRL